MTLSPRDRRALLWLGAAVIMFLAVSRFLPGPEAQPVAPAAADPSAVEQRLERTRQRIATREELQTRLAAWQQALAQREQRIIRAETPARAQETVLSVVRKIASQQSPPIELATVDPGKVEPFAETYGEAVVTVSFRSSIEGLLNLLAELSQQPELVGTKSIQITSLQDQQKQVSVRLTVAGVVPGELAPKRQGGPKL